MKKEIKKTSVQLIKYALVGASNSLITLCVIYILISLLDVNLYVSNVIGYIAGLINSFIWNKQWVFKSHNHQIKKEIILFGVGFLICYGLQILTVWIGMSIPYIKGITFSFMNYSTDHFGEFIATMAGMVVYTLCNYIYNRCITFKAKTNNG